MVNYGSLTKPHGLPAYDTGTTGAFTDQTEVSGLQEPQNPVFTKRIYHVSLMRKAGLTPQKLLAKLPR